MGGTEAERLFEWGEIGRGQTGKDTEREGGAFRGSEGGAAVMGDIKDHQLEPATTTPSVTGRRASSAARSRDRDHPTVLTSLWHIYLFCY